MRRLLWPVVATCLLQALVLCFLLVPIRVVAFPATSTGPALWLVLDFDGVRQSLQCLGTSNPLACFQWVGDIFAFGRTISVRLGICLLAVAAGVLTFCKITAVQRPP
jgi:hypothetical protein